MHMLRHWNVLVFHVNRTILLELTLKFIECCLNAKLQNIFINIIQE